MSLKYITNDKKSTRSHFTLYVLRAMLSAVGGVLLLLLLSFLLMSVSIIGIGVEYELLNSS